MNGGHSEGSGKGEKRLLKRTCHCAKRADSPPGPSSVGLPGNGACASHGGRQQAGPTWLLTAPTPRVTFTFVTSQVTSVPREAVDRAAGAKAEDSKRRAAQPANTLRSIERGGVARDLGSLSRSKPGEGSGEAITGNSAGREAGGPVWLGVSLKGTRDPTTLHAHPSMSGQEKCSTCCTGPGFEDPESRRAVPGLDQVALSYEMAS